MSLSFCCLLQGSLSPSLSPKFSFFLPLCPVFNGSLVRAPGFMLRPLSNNRSLWNGSTHFRWWRAEHSLLQVRTFEWLAQSCAGRKWHPRVVVVAVASKTYDYSSCWCWQRILIVSYICTNLLCTGCVHLPLHLPPPFNFISFLPSCHNTTFLSFCIQPIQVLVI